MKSRRPAPVKEHRILVVNWILNKVDVDSFAYVFLYVCTKMGRTTISAVAKVSQFPCQQLRQWLKCGTHVHKLSCGVNTNNDFGVVVISARSISFNSNNGMEITCVFFSTKFNKTATQSWSTYTEGILICCIIVVSFLTENKKPQLLLCSFLLPFTGF